MQFTPKSRDELRPTLPDGEYSATVIKAEDTVSKRGNDMIALTLRIYGDTGNVLANDWLIPNAAGMWKVFNFCEAANKMDRYNDGDLTANDCLNAEVIVKVKTEAQEGFDPQPRIKDYLKERTAQNGKPKYETAPEIIARQGANPASNRAARAADAEKGSSDIPF